MKNPKLVNEFNEGGSHSQNPNGGIPVGSGLVEQDETSVDFDDGQYIFSNRLYVNNTDSHIPIKLPKDLSFAEASKYIEDKYAESGNTIELETKKEALTALRNAQETVKVKLGKDDEQEFARGGKRMYIDGGTISNIGTGLTTAGTVLQAIPGIGTIAGTALMGLGSLGNVIGGAMSKKEGRERQEDLTRAQAVAASNNAEFNQGKVFAEGGLNISTNLQGGALLPETFDTSGVPAFDPAGYFTENSLRTNDTFLAPVEEPVGFQFRMPTPDTFAANSESVGLPQEVAARDSVVPLSTQQPPAPKTVSLFGQELETPELIGLGTQYASSLASNIINLASADRPSQVNPRPVGSPRSANLQYLDEIRREITRSQQSATNALANRSGGDFNQFASRVNQLHATTANALGRSFTQQQQINNQERLATDQFNLRQSELTQRNAMTADQINAQNEAAFNDFRADARDAIFANVSSLGKSVQNIGQGDRELKALLELFKSQGLLSND